MSVTLSPEQYCDGIGSDTRIIKIDNKEHTSWDYNSVPWNHLKYI